jgi:flagellar biosynthesis protein FliQ
MNDVTVVEIARESIWVMLLTGGPLLLVGLLIGLIVALLQALTTIQEMTLTFAPKIVGVFLALIVLLPFMITTLSDFTTAMFGRIAVGP